MKPKVILLSTPFIKFSLPSLQMANISSYLKKNKIDVQSEFLSIKYVEYIGWDNYKVVRDEKNGQRMFSNLLFSEYKSDLNIKNIDTGILENEELYNIKKLTKDFFKNFVFSEPILKSTIFVFYLYHYQMLSSLYFAKLLKDKYDCEIWFSGFHCKGALGENLKELFPFIDKTFGENIEEDILNSIINEKHNSYYDSLNFIPTPDYDDFYKASLETKEIIPAFRKNNINYQVEFARGCRWDKCSFCTLNCAAKSFRTRDVDMILMDYKKLTYKYSTSFILPEHFIMPCDWDNWILKLASYYKHTLKNLNLNFRTSDLLSEEKIEVLKKAEANVLIGIESFSNKYLKLMNKGHSVIQNIQVLKWLERWKVPCFHNILCSLPFEDEEIFDETEKVIELIYHLQPPFDIEEFRLTYDSFIFNNQVANNISKVECKNEYAELFPIEFLEKYKPFFYDFTVNIDRRIPYEKWEALIEKWRGIYYEPEYKSIPTQDCLLMICKNDTIYQIVDRRYGAQNTIELSQAESKIYEFLNEIRDKDFLFDKFNKLSKSEIENIIAKLEANKLIYIENNNLLALAI